MCEMKNDNKITLMCMCIILFFAALGSLFTACVPAMPRECTTPSQYRCHDNEVQMCEGKLWSPRYSCGPAKCETDGTDGWCE